MQPHIRAIVAAAAHAFITGCKVAGIYDHAADRHLRIAAEARGEHLQGLDGDRQARFGGSLPELRDVGDGASVHMEVEGLTARGFDRSSGDHFTVRLQEKVAQLYDHGARSWFTYDVQVA